MRAYGCGKSGVIHRDVQTPFEPKQPDGRRLCACCRRELPLSDFGANKNTADGLSAYCRPCARDKLKIQRSR